MFAAESSAMVTIFYCLLLAILASYQAYGAVNLQLDAGTITCAEGIEIVDQRVCPQQGFVCMTNTGVLLWETTISTLPPNTLYVTGNDLNMPITVMLGGGEGTELFVTILTADDTLGNLTSTLTITDSYNIATATVTCSDGIGAGINMESHMLQVVTNMPSPPNVMHSISDAVCDNTMPGTADVTVSWQCPVDTGATVITGFYVSVNGIILTTASGTDSSYTIPGLALGETHDIAVAASNCLGTGAASQVQVALPGAPFPPVNLAVVRSSCNQLTVTWQNDVRNGDLPCPVTGIAFDYTVNGGGGQSLSLSATDMTQCIDIAGNTGTYDITVSYINGRGFSGDTVSLLDVDGSLVEQSGVMVLDVPQGCSISGLVTSEQVTISPIIASYRNGETVMYSCISEVQTTNGPDRRICQNGIWDPPLTEETVCTDASLNASEILAIAVIFSLVLAFISGMTLMAVMCYCYSYHKKKGRYTPGDCPQPAPTYEVPSQPGIIELKENVAYGPVGH